MSKEYVAVGYNVDNGVVSPVMIDNISLVSGLYIDDGVVVQHRFKAGYINIRFENKAYESFMCRTTLANRLNSRMSDSRIVRVEKTLAMKLYNDIIRSCDYLNRRGLYHVYYGKGFIINDLSNFKPNIYFGTIKALLDVGHHLTLRLSQITITETDKEYQLEKLLLSSGDIHLRLSKQGKFKIMNLNDNIEIKDIVLEANRIQAYFLNEILYNDNNNTLKVLPL